MRAGRGRERCEAIERASEDRDAISVLAGCLYPFDTDGHKIKWTDCERSFVEL